MLDGVELEGCRFERAVLEGAVLRDCTFTDCVFTGCNLNRVDLSGSRFSRLHVRGVHRAGRDLDARGGGDAVGAAVGPRAVPARPRLVPGGRRSPGRGWSAARCGRPTSAVPTRSGSTSAAATSAAPSSSAPTCAGRAWSGPWATRSTRRRTGCGGCGSRRPVRRGCWPRWDWSSRTDRVTPDAPAPSERATAGRPGMPQDAG